MADNENHTFDQLTQKFRCRHCDYTSMWLSAMEEHFEKEHTQPAAKVVPISGKFKPTKNSDLPVNDRRIVYTCNCGCQVFWVHSAGYLECIACDKETPTLDVFS